MMDKERTPEITSKGDDDGDGFGDGFGDDYGDGLWQRMMGCIKSQERQRKRASLVCE